MKVLQFPLTRITIGFVMGILIAYYFKLDILFVFTFLFIAFGVFFIVFLMSQKRRLNPIYFGATLFILSIGIGASTQAIHTASFQKTNYIHKKGIFDKPHVVSITIREKLKYSKYNDRYIAIVTKIDDSLCSGRVLLNVQKDSLKPIFEVGSHLLIEAILYKNSLPKNPNQFDYGHYLEKNQIYSQIYTNTSDIKLGSMITKDVWYYTSKLRTKIIRNLQNNNFNKAELDVVIALILGQKQDISPDIIRDYQYAGAVHILSVSGLHIGIILLFLNSLLKPIPNTRKGSFIKLIIILVSLFSFAIVAGMSPSVLRSVTMFSFVAIGMYLRRSTYIYHTLLVSALLILLFKPSFLFEVGFQLSYLALFFILWLQPLVFRLWSPKYKIVNYFWEILTVSIAAQIGVLPLSIYYFHQFPGLFFITNLIVIPFLSILMPLGVVVIILAAFGIVPFFLSKILEWGILIMNKVIHFIASYEQFIIQDIPFDGQLLVSVYFLIIAFVIWFKKPNFNRLVMVLISIICLQLFYLKTQWTIQNQKELIVFNTKKNTLIAERNGEEVVLFSNEINLEPASRNNLLSAYLMGNFSHLKSKKKLHNFLFFKDTKILIVDSLSVYPKNSKPDVIVLTQSPKINLNRLLESTKPSVVIADATNFKTYIKIWNATCIKKKIPFHATGEKGFYKLE